MVTLLVQDESHIAGAARTGASTAIASSTAGSECHAVRARATAVRVRFAVNFRRPQ